MSPCLQVSDENTVSYGLGVHVWLTCTGETRILMELTAFYKVVHILKRTLELAVVGIPAHNPSTWAAEAGGSGVRSHPQLHGELGPAWATGDCLKQTKTLIITV